MTKYLSLTEDIIVNIEEKLQTMTIAIKYFNKSDWYWISVIADSTGFDLCSSSHGYYNSSMPRTKRLRTENSIIAEMHRHLIGYAEAIQRDAASIILTHRTIKANISHTEVYTDIPEARIFSAANIHSAESGLCISWHVHDVFKQGDITLVAYRANDGQLKFKANEADLYDKNKLRALYNSDRFKNKDYSFFFYNEVARLVGAYHGDTCAMTGLFK